MECARPLCPSQRHRTQPRISDECLDLVEKRKKLKLVDHENCRQLNREVREKLHAEREAYWNRVAAISKKRCPSRSTARYTAPSAGYVERQNQPVITSKMRIKISCDHFKSVCSAGRTYLKSYTTMAHRMDRKRLRRLSPHTYIQ